MTHWRSVYPGTQKGGGGSQRFSHWYAGSDYRRLHNLKAANMRRRPGESCWEQMEGAGGCCSLLFFCISGVSLSLCPPTPPPLSLPSSLIKPECRFKERQLLYRGNQINSSSIRGGALRPDGGRRVQLDRAPIHSDWVSGWETSTGRCKHTSQCSQSSSLNQTVLHLSCTGPEWTPERASLVDWSGPTTTTHQSHSLITQSVASAGSDTSHTLPQHYRLTAGSTWHHLLLTGRLHPRITLLRGQDCHVVSLVSPTSHRCFTRCHLNTNRHRQRSAL